MATQEYEIDLPTGKSTVLLSDEEAKARGLTAKASTPANKSASATNKSAASASKRDEIVSKSMNRPSTKGDGS
jgi:hypothetical protein